MMKRLPLPLLALLGASALSAPDAEACSPVLPELSATLPADGDEVPTNPVMALTWRFGRIQYSARYRVEGSTTSVDLGLVPEEIWVPDVVPTLALPELAPGTRITVIFDPVDLGQSEQVTFTYGATRDTTPPATPATPVLSVHHQ